MVLQRSHFRWQHPATQVRHPLVMDLGLRSDPNLHRAHSGPLRVRIEARQRSGWRQQDFWKADREIDLYVADRNGEKSGRTASTHSTSGEPAIGGTQPRTAGGKEV